MSTTEASIQEIDTEYWELRKIIEGHLAALRNGNPISDRKIVDLLAGIVKFQTLLESKEIQNRSFSNTSYYERASAKFLSILDLFTTEKVLTTYGGEPIVGLLKESKVLMKAAYVASQQVCLTGIYLIVKDIELELVQLFGDLRLMSGLMTFSIEQKVRINNELFDSGFKEAVGYLDEAQENLRVDPPHLKDSLSNCRLAVESVVYSLAEREKIQVKKRFGLDLQELAKSNPVLVDEATKVAIQGVYNYLSVKGSHTFGKVQKSDLEEVEFGFDQTFRILDHVLARINSLKRPKP